MIYNYLLGKGEERNFLRMIYRFCVSFACIGKYIVDIQQLSYFLHKGQSCCFVSNNNNNIILLLLLLIVDTGFIGNYLLGRSLQD